MTTYLGKSCSFCLPRVPFVNCRQFMYLVISLLVLRAGYGIWLYQFLIIAYLFTFPPHAVTTLLVRTQQTSSPTCGEHAVSQNTTNFFPTWGDHNDFQNRSNVNTQLRNQTVREKAVWPDSTKPYWHKTDMIVRLQHWHMLAGSLHLIHDVCIYVSEERRKQLETIL